MTLTAISSKTARSLLIDSTNLAMVMHSVAREQNQNKEHITFTDRLNGNAHGSFDAAEWGLDIQTVTDNLKAQGCNLHPMPYIFGDRLIGTVWINPNAFQSVITSESSIEANEGKATLGVLLDVEGYGRIETKMPVATLEKFLANVAKVKPNLMKITPDLAHARFYKPGYTLFDADQVESLRPNGDTSIDVNLYGAAMMGAGRIDFNLNCGDGRNSMNSIIINRMAKKYHGLLKIDDLNKDDTFHTLSWRAQEYSKKRGIKLMESFCAALAEKAPQLVKIPYTKEPHYVNPSRVAFAYATEKQIGFNFVKPAYRTHPTDMTVHFGNNGDAEKSLNEIHHTPARKLTP